MAASSLFRVLPAFGDDGQPQWAIHVTTPLTTQAVAALCKAITQQGGVIRSIAFVATVPLLDEEVSAVKLSPQLQLNVQGPTLATPTLKETVTSTLGLLL